MNKIKESLINKKKAIRDISIKAGFMATTVLVGYSVPTYATMNTLQIDDMGNVASSLQNVVKYIGLFFVAAGAITAFYGAYKIFQSIKSQDSESRSSAILEFGAGLGAIAVGAAAAVFSAYIKVS